MALNAESRRRDWLNRVQSEENFQQHYFHGSQEFDGRHHQFRDEDSSKFFGKRNLLSYSYQTSKDHPNRCYTEQWLRDRAKSQEKGNNIIHNFKNELERVNFEMKNQNKKSFEPLNTETLFDSKFKQLSKNKTFNKKPFITMSGRKDQAWSLIPIIEGPSDYDPYNEKYGSVKDLARQRNSLKEVGAIEFDSCSKPDTIWSNRLQISNSIRNYKQIQGQIKTINGKYDYENQTSRDNQETLKSLNSTKNIRFLKKVQSQQQISENSSNANRSRIEYCEQSQPIIGPAPTKFNISNGDISKVEEFLNMKKEYTQKTSLFYIPNQQLQSTQNQKFKASSQINDNYLMSKIQQAKKKSFYKSAETNFNKDQLKQSQSQLQNYRETQKIFQKELQIKQNQVDHSGFQVISNQKMTDIITSIDIGQLLLSEHQRDGSKDNSPLISSKRQLSIHSGEDQDTPSQMQLLTPHSMTIPTSQDFYTQETTPSLRAHTSQQEKVPKGTSSIQEESDETEEDSPQMKQKSKIQNHQRIRKDSISSNVSLINQKNSYHQQKMKAEIEKKKREFYALNPIIHKDLRSQQLNEMMSDFFNPDPQYSEQSQKDTKTTNRVSKLRLK